MTDDQLLIERLLSRMEGETLDFKRDQYRLESEQQKSEFVKDIIAMANTPRDEPAYILIGVEDNDGRPGALRGSSEHHDPAVFQDLVVGHTNPPLRLSYRTIAYFGVVLGLFEVPLNQEIPVMASRRFGRLTPGIVYIRRNGQNSEAQPSDIRRIITWSSGRSAETPDDSLPDNSWESFFRTCDYFDSGNVYVAVLSASQDISSDDAEAFSNVPWQLVVDFNQATNQDGFYAQVESLLSPAKIAYPNDVRGAIKSRESYNFGLDSCQRAGESTLYDPNAHLERMESG